MAAPANQGVRVNRIGVSFKGTSNTQAPVHCEVVRQTSAGTMTTAGYAPVKRDSGVSSTLQTTGAHTATVEPTTTDVMHSEFVHPQTGVQQFMSLQHDIVLAPGERMGIRMVADAAIDTSWTVDFEE